MEGSWQRLRSHWTVMQIWLQVQEKEKKSWVGSILDYSIVLRKIWKAGGESLSPSHLSGVLPFLGRGLSYYPCHTRKHGLSSNAMMDASVVKSQVTSPIRDPTLSSIKVVGAGIFSGSSWFSSSVVLCSFSWNNLYGLNLERNSDCLYCPWNSSRYAVISCWD